MSNSKLEQLDILDFWMNWLHYSPSVPVWSPAIGAQPLLLPVLLHALLRLHVRRGEGVVGVHLHLCGLFPGSLWSHWDPHFPGKRIHAAEHRLWSHGEPFMLEFIVFCYTVNCVTWLHTFENCMWRCVALCVANKLQDNIDKSLSLLMKQLQLWSGGLGRSVAALKNYEVSSYIYKLMPFQIYHEFEVIHNYCFWC